MSAKNWLLWLGAAGAGAWLAARVYRELNGYDFRNKIVLVTGGSRGLGLVLARQLVRLGAWVAICARDREELHRAHEDLSGLGGRVLTAVCDVTDQHQAEELVALVRQRFGPIDVLINNAGTIGVGPVETMTLEDFREAMNTNFWSALYLTLAVLPEMRRSGHGRIVNISSIGGKISVPHLIPYSASKFALVGLSEGLRAELSKEGIVVTTVCPGLMRTGSPRNANFKGQHRAEYAWFSISDSLPLLTLSAESAANQIIAACRRGDAEITLSLPAQCAVLFHGVFPGLTTDLLAMTDRLLPGPGGVGTQRMKGKDSQSEWSPSWLTALSDLAAQRNNEIPPREEPGGLS